MLLGLTENGKSGKTIKERNVQSLGLPRSRIIMFLKIAGSQEEVVVTLSFEALVSDLNIRSNLIVFSSQSTIEVEQA